MKKLATFVAAALLATGLASGANADLQLGDRWDVTGTDPNFTYAPAAPDNYDVKWICSSCEGLVGDPTATWDASFADGYNLPSNDHETTVEVYNDLTGSNVALDAGGKIADLDPAQDTYALSAQANNVYYFKYGVYTSYILALADETITFMNIEGGPAALSNLGVIPLPAAAWLLLTAVGGLAFVGRRRRHSEA